jgi:hypothetical protein
MIQKAFESEFEKDIEIKGKEKEKTLPLSVLAPRPKPSQRTLPQFLIHLPFFLQGHNPPFQPSEDEAQATAPSGPLSPTSALLTVRPSKAAAQQEAKPARAPSLPLS